MCGQSGGRWAFGSGWGSLQVEGDRLRVTAQLISADTGIHIWSGRYDRQASELLQVQDEITDRIAVTLIGWQGQITETERIAARRKKPVDLDAYDNWLLGVEAKHHLTAESLSQAQTYMRRGLAKAPDFAPLSRDLAATYAVAMEIGTPYDFDEAVSTYIALANRRFYALEPNDATANYYMGLTYMFRGDIDQAERFVEMAAQLAPSNSDVAVQLAWHFLGSQTPRATALVEKVTRLNPNYPSWYNFPIAETYFAAHRWRCPLGGEGCRLLAQPGRAGGDERRSLGKWRKPEPPGRLRAGDEPKLDRRKHVSLWPLRHGRVPDGGSG